MRGLPAALFVFLLTGGCDSGPATLVTPTKIDRTTETASRFPEVAAVALVGSYPAAAKSGGGYFYDDVLEYRVWVEGGAGDGNDGYSAFACYEHAKRFADATPAAQGVVALVRQKEWFDEPSKGQFVHKTGTRLTEWLPDWLGPQRRTPDAISEFRKTHAAAMTEGGKVNE